MLTTIKNVDDYIALQPENIREKLEKLRQTITTAAPAATEVISYGMPAYKLNGMLVYFAAHKQHIGFYPMPSAILAFKTELTNYVTAKATVQFPYDKPIPYGLVKKIIQLRVKENINKKKK